MSEITIITPKGDSRGSGFTPIFTRWELIKALALRSIRSRFRGTRLGIFWALAQPLVYMLVLNTFFSLINRFETGGIPYPLHLLTGLVFFQLFTKGLSEGTNAIKGNQGILSRIYIPPIVFPASSILSGLVDFIFPFVLLIALLAYYQIVPGANILFFPVALFMLLLLYSATQLFMSVMAVRYKDFGMLVPIVSQLLFFGTPIFYPITAIPEKYAAIFAINPMVGVVELFRWSILGEHEFPDNNVLLVSGVTILIFSLVSIVVFRQFSRNLPNYIE